MLEQSFIWWVLVTLGIILVIAELFIGAFVVLWFGIGAILAGFLTLLIPNLNVGLQLLFSVLVGGMLMLTLRKRYTTSGNAQPEAMHTFSATQGRLHISSSGAVSVFANGTFWSIHNLHSLQPEQQIEGALVSIVDFKNNQAVLAQESSEARLSN
ncbi:MAG TPA: NfeD family protein [Thiopseudomonas sp.]|nr:NfeD family protein [Thiopseudomonas sp.]